MNLSLYEKTLRYFRKRKTDITGKRLLTYQERIQHGYGQIFSTNDISIPLNNSIDRYFASEEYKKGSRSSNDFEALPILEFGDIKQLCDEEDAYQKTVNKFVSLVKNVSITQQAPPDVITRIGECLGVLPSKSVNYPLYRWLFSSDICPTLESIQIASILLAPIFMDNQSMYFPNMGAVTCQPRGAYYYRGERKFYGSSRPTAYRLLDKEDNLLSPELVYRLARIRVEDASEILEEIDAFKRWKRSEVIGCALMQHYGLNTFMLDITSHLKTALFFASCRYVNGSFAPIVTKNDVPHKEQYGVLHRASAEFVETQWALSPKNAGFDIISPIGHQPFMRCAKQYAYGIIPSNPNYDVFKDPQFEEFRIHQTAELCEWIYSEMDCGKKIYPDVDVPDLERFFRIANDSCRFSRPRVESLFADLQLPPQRIKELEQELYDNGFSLDRQQPYISNSESDQINRNYPVERAYEIDGPEPYFSYPFIPDTLVTVFIKAHNAEANLADCLNSLRCQSYEMIEVIVGYIPSTDNTLQIIKDFIDLDARFSIVFFNSTDSETQMEMEMKKKRHGVIAYEISTIQIIDGNFIKKMISSLVS